MATVILQSVGAAVGGSLAGGIGSAVGQAGGAILGNLIDQSVFSKDRLINGPRLDRTRILSSTPGAPIPKIYGRNRLSGQIIWATRFEERVESSVSGGKGGRSRQRTRTQTRHYFANIAIGLCEGPVTCLQRVWADGQELDLTRVNYRFYKGSANQEPDPLIEAKQGQGNTPAYRGTSYVVFEDFHLEKFGNRLPQFSFEILRAVGALEKEVRAVCIIPGSTEFGYDPELVAQGGGSQAYKANNRHISFATTDWEASMDELQAVCPNLEKVALIVAWFGTDLRARHCRIRPGVTNRALSNWKVGRYRSKSAHLVSQIDNRPAYGGTPDDDSVRRAIRDLKMRGLKVFIYPFIMMDIPDNNALPNPDGGESQPPYPWRGMISCHPGIGQENSVDQSEEGKDQIRLFTREYRRLISHYINLSVSAGGVDGLLIGSQMRGLTRVRDHRQSFPFVGTLIGLARIARRKLGEQCVLTYAANWSEYFGYHPVDGNEDVFYNLDRLWADKSINAVGIDNYMPISDVRPGRSSLDGENTPYDIDYLIRNVSAGEGHDWYYASDRDRLLGWRTPITDGLGEPWTFRYKDLQSWWSKRHYERRGRKKNTRPTDWQPRSKPIFFTELGCPAIDGGSNQPNVFLDAKSSQSAMPHFSAGLRDDLVQRRFLEAHFSHWKALTNNPASEVYDGRMVDVSSMFLWAWDARPFPAFPSLKEIWSDGENWFRGHWLNGRLGGCSLQDLVVRILKDYGSIEAAVTLDGIVDGYIIPGHMSARNALEPLLALFEANVFERRGKLEISQAGYATRNAIGKSDLVREGDNELIRLQRISNSVLPAQVVFTHLSLFSEYEESVSKSRRIESGTIREVTMDVPVVISDEVGIALADHKLKALWKENERLSLRLSNKDLKLHTGDVLTVTDVSDSDWLVEEVRTGTVQEVSLKSIADHSGWGGFPAQPLPIRAGFVEYGSPQFVLMDLPALRDADVDRSRYLVAVNATPWAGEYSLYASLSQDGFRFRHATQSRAVTGKLVSALGPGPTGRIDQGNTPEIVLNWGALESRSLLTVLNGRNVMAVQSANDGYEILQFLEVDYLGAGNWRLTGLLRGLAGTQDEMLAGAPKGAAVVLLDQGISEFDLDDGETGISLNWRVGPSRYDYTDDTFASRSLTYSGRTRRMLRPVHLRKHKKRNGILFTWIRCGRLSADDWENPEIPVDASEERYQVRIRSADKTVLRETTVRAPSFEYQDSDMLSDFASEEVNGVLEVMQLNNTGKPGAVASITLEPKGQEYDS